MYITYITYSKSNLNRYRLYEQLRTRPKVHFSQNFKLYTFKYNAGADSFKNKAFSRRPQNAPFSTPQNKSGSLQKIHKNFLV